MQIYRYMKNLKSAMYLLLFCAGMFTITSCTKESEPQSTASENIQATGISPSTAKGGNIVTVSGSGLGSITSIMFDKGNVPAAFNPNLVTNDNIVFRVPDTANGGAQNIVITNSLGKTVSVPFTVVALPIINSASNYNFTGGTQITLIGNNLGDVAAVSLKGTTQSATIVSKSKKQLVITMPGTTVSSAPLIVNNSTGPVTTTQEFVNYDAAFKIFTEGYDNGFQDASWGDIGKIYTNVAKSGTKSVGKTFAAGNWHQMGFGWNNINKTDNYTYLTFWIKGGTKDYNLWISSAASKGGYASFNDNAKILVPKDVWTYFKIPMSQLDLFNTGNSFNQLGWRIQGPEGQDETFYLDDVMFLK